MFVCASHFAPLYVWANFPAHFNSQQRLETATAAGDAGFTTVRLMSEPAAAAVAYGLMVAGNKMVSLLCCLMCTWHSVCFGLHTAQRSSLHGNSFTGAGIGV
jgi:hypothetical protein